MQKLRIRIPEDKNLRIRIQNTEKSGRLILLIRERIRFLIFSNFKFLILCSAPCSLGRYGTVNDTRIRCCGSGMFIPDPYFYPFRILNPGSRIPDPGSRIPDPGSRIQKQQQKRGVKKN